jgi:hypothetical protein
MPNQKRNYMMIVITTILVIGCSGFNAYRQINNKVKKLEDVFMSNDSSHLSIHYDLEKIDDCMANSIALSKIYHVKSSRFKKIEKLHKEFESCHSLVEYKSWYRDIKVDLPLLFNDIEDCQLTSQHQKMLSKYQATYQSAIHTISYSEYNQLAKDYQKETDGVLAGFIKSLGIREVVTFD